MLEPMLRYDLHIHTCLSPCGDADMTPQNIVNMAVLAGLHVIAVTDHNSCGNCAAVMEAAADKPLTVLPGMELCTSEEIHAVCLFPTLAQALEFEQQVIPARMPVVNRPDIFGEQLLMNSRDEVVGREEILLTTATSISIDQVLSLAACYGGTAFPAHIDRPSYSIISALGDLPPLGFKAVEISAAGDVDKLSSEYPAINGNILLLNSDAHRLEHMTTGGWLRLPNVSDSPLPEQLIAALSGQLPCQWGRNLLE